MIIWAALALPGRSRVQRVRAAVVAIAAVLVGPVLQFLFVWRLGSDPFHTGSNFGASLYGLSTGSRDWTEPYRAFDHLFRVSEGEAFRAAYRAALDNIQARPDVFLGALAEAFSAYLDALFVFGDLGLPHVVLTSPFESLAAVGRTHYPWLPVGLLLRHRFESAAAAGRITAPALVVYGSEDTIIPAQHSERLAAAWGGPVERLRIEGHGHNDLDFDPRYAAVISAFLDRRH